MLQFCKKYPTGNISYSTSQAILPWELPSSFIKNQQRLDLLFALLFGTQVGGENSYVVKLVCAIHDMERWVWGRREMMTKALHRWELVAKMALSCILLLHGDAVVDNITGWPRKQRQSWSLSLGNLAQAKAPTELFLQRGIKI